MALPLLQRFLLLPAFSPASSPSSALCPSGEFYIQQVGAGGCRGCQNATGVPVILLQELKRAGWVCLCACAWTPGRSLNWSALEGRGGWPGRSLLPGRASVCSDPQPPKLTQRRTQTNGCSHRLLREGRWQLTTHRHPCKQKEPSARCSRKLFLYTRTFTARSMRWLRR